MTDGDRVTGRLGNAMEEETTVGTTRPRIPLAQDPETELREMLHLPGINGYPFLGPVVPDLKEGDEPKKRPTIAPNAHVRILRLWEVDELKIYERVSQAAAEGRSIISYEERQYDSEEKSWQVLIRWVDYYATMKEPK